MIDKKIVNKKDCTGCYACENICPSNSISMVDDTEGFWYPAVDYDKCIKCKKCINVCPIINNTILNNKPVVYACINNDEKVRLNSSSGGIFTLVSEEVVNQDGIVFGARFNVDFKVEHSFVESKEDLERFRGSKYVQSRIGETYKLVREFLIANRKVLFTGTPCQIAGLKSFLGKDYENLLCMDIICHGVPSPVVWEKYVNYREKDAGSLVQRITFRLKNESWKRYSISFLFKNNTEYREIYNKDLYMKAFLRDIYLRPSCYECEFKGLNRQSDITLADFWGIQNVLPEMDDDKGTSLIFINSKAGKVIFDSISKNTVCKVVNVNNVIKYNTAAIKSAQTNPNRKVFFDSLNKLDFDILVNKYCKDKYLIRIKRNLRILIVNFIKKRRQK